MATAFGSSEDSVMSRQIETHSHSSFANIAEEFDVSSTAEWINEQKFTRVRRTLVVCAANAVIVVFAL